MADDLVTTVLLATRAPVLWAPAMNTNMWRHPATQANLATLRSRGARFVGPDAGDLACGWIGQGRMMDPPVIVDAAEQVLRQRGARDDAWAGRKVMVTAGPTRAYLDPVRFFTNASTGAMGFALAEIAAARGADVTLVSGPVERPTPSGCRRISVETADEMLSVVGEELASARHDLVAMVAAVADLAPAGAAHSKLAKDDLVDALAKGALVEGVDVLATLVRDHGTQTYFLGFGAQTVSGDDPKVIEASLTDAGRKKIASKGCDAIFVNRVGVPGHGFSSDTNTGLLVYADGRVVDAGPLLPKPALAGWLLDQLVAPVTDKRGRGAA
jgi:phosphopantothenoylcysteine decarboxylase/phosphopantothenate--cysteine ligase